MSATNRVKDLLAVTGRLADVLASENKVLKSRDRTGLAGILDEKTTLGRVYESRIDALVEMNGELAEVDLDLRERLRGMGEKISGLMTENAKLLKVAIEANRRVVDMIAAAVKESAPGPGTYAANGAIGVERHRGAPHGLPLSLNQSL